MICGSGTGSGAGLATGSTGTAGGAAGVAMAGRMGSRLRHVHLTDGSGSAKDEHLVPGRGAMDAAGFLGHLADAGFDGRIVLEINTRKCSTRQERERDLVESLSFAREHFVVPSAHG